jgi:hypothetical protein
VDSTLILHVAEEGAPDERIDVLARYLRQELLSLDGTAVTAVTTGSPPAGARGLESFALGGLLVTVSQSAQGIHALLVAVRQWLDRAPATGRTVRLELDGDVLVLSGATSTHEARLVDLFVNRHLERGTTGGESTTDSDHRQ